MKIFLLVVTMYGFNPYMQPQIKTHNPVGQWLMERPVPKPRKRSN